VLGLAGCLLHVWNHSLFKSLLFLSAGSVVHATHTREIDQMGGLGRSMPWTASMFLVGALAICGLPPLNGFVSELLIYLGLFRTAGLGAGPSWMGAAFGAPVLAMIGALALACFVKAFGAVFLGLPRGAATENARESPANMIGPMGVLAACCALIGLAPWAVAPILDRVASSWAGGSLGEDATLGSLAPLISVSALGTLFLLLSGAASIFLMNRLRPRDAAGVVTWSCGYAQPTARMQYTASSFAQMLVSLFRLALRPRTHRPELYGMFPRATRFESHVDDVVLDRQIMPFARVAEQWFGRLRGLQQGVTQHYILSILITVIALLAWTMPIDEFIAGLFAR
jgi:hydrogenase-4 component B